MGTIITPGSAKGHVIVFYLATPESQEGGRVRAGETTLGCHLHPKNIRSENQQDAVVLSWCNH